MIKLVDAPLFTRLTSFALLAVKGNDRHAFLHGQFINDLNIVEQSGVQLSAWCNPKGQVISNFFIINTGTTYLLLFKNELKEFVQKRLSMFVLRADVKIEDISNDVSLLGIANTDELSSLGLNASISAGEVKSINELTIVCLPDNSGRYLAIGNQDNIDVKENELAQTLKQTDSETWELLDILAGLAWITATTQEQFLPQMLNLDSLNGLSYQKGCFPGQEVIARLHYKGTVKKRITLIRSEQDFTIGDKLCVEKPDNSVGTIINIAKHTDGNNYALAVIELDKLAEKLLSEQHPDTPIDILELPYAKKP